MKKARIAELKNNLSRYLEHVRGGGSVLVLDRDRPIAQLAPLTRTVSTTVPISSYASISVIERLRPH